ncbi:MAG: ABC transporter permease [Candidatus Izimaplasma sp.]|nr:ABC transporter permease [Candidatus Izimaplasma bacterium]
MKRYYIKRVLSALATIIIIASVTFFIMKFIPGGPFTREKKIPQSILDSLNAKYGLDEPLLIQYKNYMLRLLQFDLGVSFKQQDTTVNEMIAQGFPTSAKVGILASSLIVLVGIPIGIISALKKSSAIDYSVMFLATLGVTVPNFVIATLIIYFFAGQWNILPTSGISEGPLSYVGPMIALAGYSLSFVARLTRSSMLEVLRQDYVRTARANGLSEFKVIYKHALKNAMIPVLTYLGPMIAAILTGSFVVEKIFVLPGMGRFFVESVTNRNFTVTIGFTVFYAVFYIIMILLVDIAYSIIDPRIRLDS